MSDKPFLTYRQQLKRIKDKRILVADDDFVLEILKTMSYYGIVNGYKDIFGVYYDEEMKLERFSDEVTFEQLHRIALIDNSLNNLLFKYIIYIEKALKTKLAYIVARKYGILEEQYLDFKKYTSRGLLDRKNEIENIKNQIKSNKNSASVQHYREKHDCIPPWISVNALYFGTVINWYKISEDNIKTEISNDFLRLTNLNDDEERKELFVSAISLLQEYRNNIAHGNRTFLSNVSHELSKNILLKSINNKILTESEYLSGIGQKDLFAVMLVLAILTNDPILFQQYIFDLEAVLLNYSDETLIISPKGNIFQTLHIPNNFLDRLSEIYNIKFSN